MESWTPALAAALIAAAAASSVFVAERIIHWRLQRRELRRVEFERVIHASVAYVDAAITEPHSDHLDERAVLMTATATLPLNLAVGEMADDLSLAVDLLSGRIIAIGRDRPSKSQEVNRARQLYSTLECLTALIAIFHHGRWYSGAGEDLFLNSLMERDVINAPTFVGDPLWWDVSPPEWLTPTLMPTL